MTEGAAWSVDPSLPAHSTGGSHLEGGLTREGDAPSMN